MATYRRFDAVNRVMHGVLMLSFLGLSATGLPLLFGESRWAATLADVLGGIEICGRLHRLSAAVLIPAVLADVWAGGIWFHLFVALIGILMVQEWVTIVHRDNPRQFALHAAGAMCGSLLPLDIGIEPGWVSRSRWH